MAEQHLPQGNKVMWRDATGQIRDDHIQPSCATEGGSAPGGQWYCVTHQEGFRNNLEISSHVQDGGDHTTMWICSEHGPEVP
jgi:hypothetical protein